MKKPILDFHINKEGYFVIGLAIIITCIMFALAVELGLICLYITSLVIYFFRDPVRMIVRNENNLLSPADGVVYSISEALSPSSTDLNETMTRVSIFLSVLDVHVNRLPVSGTVRKLNYIVGKFIRADSYVSEEANEKQEILIEALNGKNIIVVQQAGFVARRIVCDLLEGHEYEQGSRFGIIKFGSRVDLYFPKEYKLCVRERQMVIGGETIIAALKNEDNDEEEDIVVKFV